MALNSEVALTEELSQVLFRRFVSMPLDVPIRFLLPNLAREGGSTG